MSIRTLATDDRANGVEQNLQVQQKRIVSNIIQIILNVEGRGLVGSPNDLPPAGYARWHAEALVLPRLIILHNQGEFWTGPNNAHLAFEHIEELRQFVQTPATQVPADTSDAWVILAFAQETPAFLRLGHDDVYLTWRINSHRPELVY